MEKHELDSGKPIMQDVQQRRCLSWYILRVSILLSALVIYFSVPRGLDTNFPGYMTSTCLTMTNESFDDTARHILSNMPLIDGHNDLAFLIRALFGNHIYTDKFENQFGEDGLPFHVDLPRLKTGQVGGAFWSAFVQCPSEYNHSSEVNKLMTVQRTLEQIDLIHRLTTAYPKRFSSPLATRDEAVSAFKNNHQLISPIGIEGLHQIGDSVSTLRLYQTLGVHYATLTHNCHNIFADAALVKNANGTLVAAPSYHGGLSARGQLVIREMNRMGMLIDLAHVSHETMQDVLGGRPTKCKGSEAPIMFSHSSAFSICPHPRNVPDYILQLVKRTNSIVMVNFSPDFISCAPDPGSDTGIPRLVEANATIHQVARHIMHIGDLIGYDHVGLGSDFDGIFSTPKGLEDVSKFPQLIALLLELGVTRNDVEKIVGRNILRIWKASEDVSIRLRKTGVTPLEDEIGEL